MPSKMRYEIENAFSMYADSFLVFPASHLYDQEALKPQIELIKNCHIYIVGTLPKLKLRSVKKRGKNLRFKFNVLEKMYDVDIPNEASIPLTQSGLGNWAHIEIDGVLMPHQALLSRAINKLCACFRETRFFDVLYIGQAYGKNGNRNALDRLKKHETLQKISLKGIPAGLELTILMLDIKLNTQLITLMNPRANNTSSSDDRIDAGPEMLLTTTDQERVALYEAALIRYFQPTYNFEFRNSFPSTRIKILRNCYKLDIHSVVAEINFDNLSFELGSNIVAQQKYHIAKHDLHTADDRKLFFEL